MEVPLPEVLLPRVGVRVELNERHRAVPTRHRAQLRERDRVVSAERDRKDAALYDGDEAFFDLRVRSLRVAGRDRKVAVVDDGQSLGDVDPERRVIRTDERRRAADRLGPEPRAGAVARRRVEGNAIDGGVDSGEVGDVRRAHERSNAGEARNHLRVERPVRRLGHRRTVPPGKGSDRKV